VLSAEAVTVPPSDAEEAHRDWPEWPRAAAPIEKYEKFSGRDDLVCSECVTDCAVREKVFRIHNDEICGYCGGTLGPFARDTDVFEYVYRCLGQEYGDPWHGPLFYDTEEDQHFGITKLETWEVLNDVDSPFADGSVLEQEFEKLVEHDWYRLDSQVGEYHEQLVWGWDSFERRLIDGPRFLFSLSEAEMGEEPVQSLFGFLAKLAAEVESNFVKTCKPEQVLYRARAARKILTSAKKLGSPPPKHTGPQRMSAAGVSHFYAAEDRATAVEEVLANRTKQVSVGKWVTTRPLIYADFAEKPTLPNLFDYPLSKKRPFVLFLREFVKRIDRPPDPKIGDANSYLATQVLAEYLRFGMPVAGGHGLDAVRYPSAKPGGGINWVLFGRPDRQDPPSVKLVQTEGTSPCLLVRWIGRSWFPRVGGTVVRAGRV